MLFVKFVSAFVAHLEGPHSGNTMNGQLKKVTERTVDFSVVCAEPIHHGLSNVEITEQAVQNKKTFNLTIEVLRPLPDLEVFCDLHKRDETNEETGRFQMTLEIKFAVLHFPVKAAKRIRRINHTQMFVNSVRDAFN